MIGVGLIVAQILGFAMIAYGWARFMLWCVDGLYRVLLAPFAATAIVVVGTAPLPYLMAYYFGGTP